MFGIKSVFTILAFFALFSGILTGLSRDILLLISKPSWSSVQYVIKDLASIIINSQQEITNAVEKFKTVESSVEANYLLSRIIGGSLITLFMIWLFYKIMRFFKEQAGPFEKIAMIMLAVLMVWIISVVASYLVGKVNWMPFSGWVSLWQNREIIINYVLQQYRG